jgi:hypothetical protein
MCERVPNERRTQPACGPAILAPGDDGPTPRTHTSGEGEIHMRNQRTTITLLLIGSLLLGGFGLAQTHARGGLEAFMRGRSGAAAFHGAAVAGLPQFAGLPRIAGLPIGTAVELAFHDGDPAAGGAAVTTLEFTVGVDSEVAFAAAFAAAREGAAQWDEPYLVATTSEQTRTVVIARDDDAASEPRRLHRDALGPLTTLGMGEGDSIVVTLYAGDPAAGGTPLETLAFVYGIDSEIGFRSALRAAATDADAAVVVTSPRSVTIDLAAMGERMSDVRARLGARGVEAGPFGRMDAPRRLLPGRAR